MKKLVISLIAALSVSSAFAGNMAEMKLDIKNSSHDNHYYICVYGSGCYNIKELAGKTFPVSPDNLANDTKIAVLNDHNFAMTTQPNTPPCEVNDAAGKTVTFSGELVAKNGQGYINNLRCSVN